MLLNSVARDGDAAVYKRTADEAVKLAYGIAVLTGFDKTFNRQAKGMGAGVAHTQTRPLGACLVEGHTPKGALTR